VTARRPEFPLTWFTEGFYTADLKDAKALLDTCDIGGAEADENLGRNCQ
jgi:hypothetical protein